MKQGMSPSGNEHMIDIKDFGSVKSCGFIQKYKWGGGIFEIPLSYVEFLLKHQTFVKRA